MTTAPEVFLACVTAIRDGVAIERASSTDKEFPFQNWFGKRLDETRLKWKSPGRNSYPDFPLVDFNEGYEAKALAVPGRFKNYDANSQVPTGQHNGRTIYYVFGRYPKESGKEAAVQDLVICHGDFLNADHEYKHKNANVKHFGTYGDLMIRDRKMYVAPTPFALVPRTTGSVTLILPQEEHLESEKLRSVGQPLERVEVAKLVVSYTFDLRSGTLDSSAIDNPNKDAKHVFVAYRHRDSGGDDELKLIAPGEPTEAELELGEERGDYTASSVG